MADWADDGENAGGVLKDAWGQWNFVNADGSTVGIRTGQGKTYHGLESTGTSAGLFFVERSIASKFFADSRSRGAWLHGNHMESKLRWTAGAQNAGVSAGVDGDEEGSNEDNELVYVASANLDPMGDFVGNGKSYESYMQGDLEGSKELKGTVGVGIAIDNRGAGRTSNLLDADESTQTNLNTAWKVSNFWAGFDYFNRTDSFEGADADHDGWNLAVGYTLPKSGESNMQWGFGFRVGEVNLEDGADVLDQYGARIKVADLTATPPVVGSDEAKQWGIVLNAFYHGHKCKTQVEFNNIETGDTDAQQILVQFSIII